MSAKHARRLTEWAELLRRREPDLLVHDPGGPGECLVRAGQLVVDSDFVAPAMRLLERWVARVEPDVEAKLATLWLRQELAERCVEIAAQVAPLLPVSANHVHLVGAPVLHGTGSVPVPCPEPMPPPLERWYLPVSVAVLDTGLDPHPWFAGRSWLAEWGLQPEVLDADHDGLADQQAGHGTFVAGVLLRHAPGVTIRHRRVLTSQGVADDRTVAAALRWVRHRAANFGEHLDIVLLSAGCHTADDQCPPLLAREISRFAGAVVVAAAGNNGSTRPFWPAALPQVLAVGAPAAFANHGPWVDAIAPGVDVVSSHVAFHPVGSGVAVDTETREYGAAAWSGTSFAAPRVAAELATLLHSGHSLADARRLVCHR
ncbi:MAG: S8 family peptidase [Labedaea sp.]